VSVRSGLGSDLSRRALAVAISPTIAVAQRATALKARGETVLDFSAGEPDQPTPEHIRAAAVAALAAGETRYTPAAGLPELRAAVAKRYRRSFGLSFSLEEVAATIGGKHALYCVCQALVDRGDEVIVPSPCWATFGEAVRLAGGRPVIVPSAEADDFRVTARMLARAVSEKTRAVVLCSPSNPTGAIIHAEELRAIGALARRRRFTILYDDTYAHIVYRKPDHSALRWLRDELPERLVIIGTTSKSYCMTGWRIGWVLGPKPLIDACTVLISHSTQNPTTFAQLGAVAALNGSQAFVRELTREYRRRRDVIFKAVRSIPGVACHQPDGAFYLLPNLTGYLDREIPTTLELAARLLEKERVAVVPGEAFGIPGHFRISFSRPLPELREGVRRLASFLAARPGLPKQAGRSRAR